MYAHSTAWQQWGEKWKRHHITQHQEHCGKANQWNEQRERSQFPGNNPTLYAPFPFLVCSPFSQASALFVHDEGQKTDRFYLECFSSPLEALFHFSLTLHPSNTAPHNSTLPHPATIPPPPLPPLTVAWQRGTWKFAVMFESQPKLKARPHDCSQSLKTYGINSPFPQFLKLQLKAAPTKQSPITQLRDLLE